MLVLAHSKEAMEQEPAKNNTVIALILLSDPIRLEAPQTQMCIRDRDRKARWMRCDCCFSAFPTALIPDTAESGHPV